MFIFADLKLTMNLLTAMIAVMKVTSELADTLNSTGNMAAAC